MISKFRGLTRRARASARRRAPGRRRRGPARAHRGGLLLVAAPASGSGPSSTASAKTANVSSVVLHVGDQAGSGSQALLTAAGLLSKLPFKVEWSDFTSGPPMLQAMGSGAIDIGSVGDAPPVFAAAGGEKVAIVGAVTAGPNGSAIVVPKNSPIHSVAQLKGKKIAVAQGSSADYHLLTVLNKAHLSVHDVTLDYLQPADGLAALTSGHVDAWDIWSPYIEQAVGQDHARILVNGTGYGAPYSFAVASRAALADPAKAAADPRLPEAAQPGLRVGRLARVGLGLGVGQGHRPAGRHHAQGGQGRRADPGPDHPGRGQRRAVGVQRVHHRRADPRPRGLQELLGLQLQRHRRRGLMTLTFHWFLPTTGDGRSIMGRGHSLPPAGAAGGPAGRPDAPHIRGAAAQERPPDIEYLAQVARSAEQLGFEAVLTPTGTWCEDAWLVTAALTRETSRLKFLVAFRPGLTSPTLAAQMAATYQRLSGGRLLLNVVTGGQADEQRRFGDYLSHDERYARTGGVPGHRPGRVDRRAVRLPRRALPGGRGHRAPPAGPGAGRLLRRLLRPRRAAWRRPPRTST